MTTDNKTAIESDINVIQEQQKLYLEAYLAEYNKLENQIQEYLRENHELSIYSLVSTAGIATLVVTLISTNNAELLASVLLTLPLPFAAMLLSVLGNINELTIMGRYVSSYIEADVNTILRVSSNPLPVSVLQWETRLYTRTRLVDKWLGAGLRTCGQAALVFLPLVMSLVAYYFVVTQAQLAMKNWWVALLSFDLVLLIMVLSAVVVTLVRGLRKAN